MLWGLRLGARHPQGPEAECHGPRDGGSTSAIDTSAGAAAVRRIDRAGRSDRRSVGPWLTTWTATHALASPTRQEAISRQSANQSISQSSKLAAASLTLYKYWSNILQTSTSLPMQYVASILSQGPRKCELDGKIVGASTLGVRTRLTGEIIQPLTAHTTRSARSQH